MQGQALYDEVLKVMAPYTGAIVAKATLECQAQELGMTSATLTKAQLPELAERVAKGLSVFIGPDLGDKVGRLIEALGEVP